VHMQFTMLCVTDATTLVNWYVCTCVYTHAMYICIHVCDVRVYIRMVCICASKCGNLCMYLCVCMYVCIVLCLLPNQVAVVLWLDE
jgi:hypothetical protein